MFTAILSAASALAVSQLTAPSQPRFDFEITVIAGKLHYLEKSSGCLWVEQKGKWTLRSPIVQDGEAYFRAYCDRVLLEAKKAIQD